MFELRQSRQTPYNNQFLFAGRLFKATTRIKVQGGTEKDILFRCSSSRQVHFIVREITIDSNVLVVYLVENPIVATSANIPSFNMDRNLGTTAILKTNFCSGPGATGTILESIIAVPGDPLEQESPELILKPNVNYVRRFLVNAGTTVNANLTYIWYESNN